MDLHYKHKYEKYKRKYWKLKISQQSGSAIESYTQFIAAQIICNNLWVIPILSTMHLIHLLLNYMTNSKLHMYIHH